MQLPVIQQDVPDVLAGHEPRAQPTWRVPRRLVGGGLALALVGGVGLLAVQDDTGAAVVDASGRMVLVQGSSWHADVPHSTQDEGRDALMTGSIRVDLPDRRLHGRAEMHFSWAATWEDDVIMISHSWGVVHVTFGSTTCSGPIAKSAYREPPETGGAMSLRCDDGSLFAATVVQEPHEKTPPDRPMRIVFALEDASYVAG